MRIKGLDSLRVFSILIILIYHFFGNFMPAGFLGVNILFVMSGFLIMRNFLHEIDQSGNIDIRKFCANYARYFVDGDNRANSGEFCEQRLYAGFTAASWCYRFIHDKLVRDCKWGEL